MRVHSLGDRAISELVVVIVSHDDLAGAEVGGHLLAFGSGDAPDGLASGHASTRHLDSATMGAMRGHPAFEIVGPP